MNLTPVSSSNIHSIGYENGKLYVQFKSGGLYVYSGVPATIYKALMSAPSHGRYLAHNIKNCYPYTRLN